MATDKRTDPSAACSASPPSTAPGSFQRSAAFSFLGQASAQFLLWCLFAALARLGGAETLGRFTAALALCAPVVLLANLQLGGLLATDADPARRLGGYLGLRLGGMAVTLLVVTAIAVATVAEPMAIALAVAVAGAKTVESLADLVRGALIARERFATSACLQALRGILGLGGGIAGYAWAGNTFGAALGLGIGWALAVIIIELPLLTRIYGATALRPRLQRSEMLEVLRFAGPLGLVSAGLALTSYLPVYALGAWHDHAVVGRYAALVHLLLVGSLVVLAMGSAAAPRLARQIADGNRDAFRFLTLRLVAGCIAIGLAAALVSLLIGGPVLALAYGPEFGDLGPALSAACLANTPVWATSGLGVALTAARRITGQPTAVLASCLVGIGAVSLLVPKGGLYGAIMANACSSLILFAGCAMLMRRAFIAPPDKSLG